LMLCEGLTHDQLRSAKAKLLNVAKPFVGSGIVFGYAFVQTEVSVKVRNFVGVSSTPCLVLVDFPNQRKYVCEECLNAEIDEINILDFIKRYAKKQLKPFVKSAPRPAGDQDLLRPYITPVVASSLQELVFGATGSIVLAVFSGDPPSWMLRVAAVLKSSRLGIQDLGFAELNAATNDLDPRLTELGEAPFVCVYRNGTESSETSESPEASLRIHSGVLDPAQIIQWLHGELGKQEEGREPVLFDLEVAQDELRAVEEEANVQLKQLNVETFTEMFKTLGVVAQPRLETVLEMLAAQDSDEAGELMAYLSKVDHDPSSADHMVSLEEWLAFWNEMVELTGPYSPEQLAQLQLLLDSSPAA